MRLLPQLNIEVKKPYTVRNRGDLYAQPRYPHTKFPKIDQAFERRAQTHRYLVPLTMRSSLLNLPESYRSESRLSDIPIPESLQETWISTPLDQVPERSFDEAPKAPLKPTLKGKIELAQVIEARSEHSDTARYFGEKTHSYSTNHSPECVDRPVHPTLLSTVRLVFSGQHSRSKSFVPEVKAALVKHKRLQTLMSMGDEPTEPSSPISRRLTKTAGIAQPSPKQKPHKQPLKDLAIARPDQDEAYTYNNLFEDRNVLTSRSVEHLKQSSSPKRTLLEEFIKKVISKHIKTEKDALHFIESQLDLGVFESCAPSRKSSVALKDLSASLSFYRPNLPRSTSASVVFRNEALRGFGGSKLQKASSLLQLPDLFDGADSTKRIVFNPQGSPSLGPASDKDLSLSLDYGPEQYRYLPKSSSSSRASIQIKVVKSNSSLGDFDVFEVKPTVPDLVQIQVRDETEPFSRRSHSFSYSSQSVELQELRSAFQSRGGSPGLMTHDHSLVTIAEARTSSARSQTTRMQINAPNSPSLRKISLSKVETPTTIKAPELRVTSPESIKSYVSEVPSVEAPHELKPVAESRVKYHSSKRKLKLKTDLLTPKEESKVRQTPDPKPRNSRSQRPKKSEPNTPVADILQETPLSNREDSPNSIVTPNSADKSHLKLTEKPLSRGSLPKPPITPVSVQPSSSSSVKRPPTVTKPPSRVFVEDLHAPPKAEEAKQYIDKSSNSTDKFITNFARSLLKMVSLSILSKSPPVLVKARAVDRFSDVAEMQRKTNAANRNRFMERMVVQKQHKAQDPGEEDESQTGTALKEQLVTESAQPDIVVSKDSLGTTSPQKQQPPKKLEFGNKQTSYLKPESAIELLAKYAQPSPQRQKAPETSSSDDDSYSEDVEEYLDSRPSSGAIDSLKTPTVKKMHDIYSQSLSYELSKLSFMSRMASHILKESTPKHSADQENLSQGVSQPILEASECDSPDPQTQADIDEDADREEIIGILTSLYDGPDVKSQLKIWFAEKQTTAKLLAFTQPISFKFSDQRGEADKPFTEDDLLHDGIDLKNLQSHTLRNYFNEMQKYKPSTFINAPHKDWRLYIMESDHVSPMDKKMLRKDNIERRKLKMKRLSQILHDIKAISTMRRRPKKTFTNLEVPVLEKLREDKEPQQLKAKVDDVVLSGGANLAMSQIERLERLYCRVKGEKNLQAMRGNNTRRSKDRLETLSNLDKIMNKVWGK